MAALRETASASAGWSDGPFTRQWGPTASFAREARSDGARFDDALRRRLHDAAARRGVPAGDLPSYAGHDAGILAAHVPSAMLFVRNPTGISHAPQEHAEPDECAAGVVALTTVLEHLAR